MIGLFQIQSTRTRTRTNTWATTVIIWGITVISSVSGQHLPPSSLAEPTAQLLQSNKWPFPNSWKRSGILDAGVHGSYDGAVGDDDKVRQLIDYSRDYVCFLVATVLFLWHIPIPDSILPFPFTLFIDLFAPSWFHRRANGRCNPGWFGS